MAGAEREGGRSPQDNRLQQNTPPKEASGRQESPEGSPLVPRRGEWEGWQERPHEEMVNIIRRDLAREYERLYPHRVNPVEWMREQLTFQIARQSVAEHPDRDIELGHEPADKLLLAWEVISFPHITGHITRGNTAYTMTRKAEVLGQIITLSPQESKLFEAMAEACEIPITYGQVTVDGHNRQYSFEIRKEQVRNDG